MICKTCGTLFNPKEGPCPKCFAAQAPEDTMEPAPMSDEEAKRLRKKAWIQLVIGVPAFIGFIYLLIYLFKLIKG